VSLRLDTPRLDAAAYERLARGVYDASGIQLGDRHRSIVEARVETRLRELGLAEPAAYERLLRSGPGRVEEMDHLLDLLAVHESYFFRESSQLELAARTLLPEAQRARDGQTVRVWSAGCASGEEPYSLAILLEESRAWRDGAIEIIGTDLSPSCLKRAREGAYGSAALRDTSAARRARYFDHRGTQVSLRDKVRRQVRFQRLNLYRDRALAGLGHFDLILCRNVLLYFDAAARARVVACLHEHLRAGGWLVVGRAETLLNVPSPLEAFERDGEVVYRRPEGSWP